MLAIRGYFTSRKSMNLTNRFKRLLRGISEIYVHIIVSREGAKGAKFFINGNTIFHSANELFLVHHVDYLSPRITGISRNFLSTRLQGLDCFLFHSTGKLFYLYNHVDRNNKINRLQGLDRFFISLCKATVSSVKSR